jgi:hypothetical protein
MLRGSCAQRWKRDTKKLVLCGLLALAIAGDLSYATEPRGRLIVYGTLLEIFVHVKGAYDIIGSHSGRAYYRG